MSTKLTERAIIEQLTSEIWGAKKQSISGEIVLTIGINQGTITRSKINRERALTPQPEGERVQRFDGGD